MSPSPFRLAALLALACILGAPAQAQAPQPSRARAAAGVPAACKAEIARFCPGQKDAAPQPRTAAICLKPFKSSLSLSCRRAVRAVFP